jgi:hypothetical protein
METFTTSKGVGLSLKAVSQFKIDALRAAKADIPVPTYKFQVVGGEEQEYPLDAEIAKNKDRLDEWIEYVLSKNKAESEYAKKFFEMMVWEGVDITVPGTESDWQKTSEYFGIKIPENPIERKTFYVYNELIGTAEDVGELIAGILSVSGVDEKAVSTIRESFRPGISRTTNSELPEVKELVEGEQVV